MFVAAGQAQSLWRLWITPWGESHQAAALPRLSGRALGISNKPLQTSSFSAQPLLTAGLAAAVLGQLLAGRDVAAMGIILAGVACVISAKLADDRRRWSPVLHLVVSRDSQGMVRVHTMGDIGYVHHARLAGEWRRWGCASVVFMLSVCV